LIIDKYQYIVFAMSNGEVCYICGESRGNLKKCPYCGHYFCERHYAEHCVWEEKHKILTEYSDSGAISVWRKRKKTAST
jgi:predicted nucleic acid binding AN1-type Zn finger protein